MMFWLLIPLLAFALRKANASAPAAPLLGGQLQYPPFSADAVRLFMQAAALAGLPTEWASDPGLHSILTKESRGRVGVPNYTYGPRAADPSLWPQVWSEIQRGVHSTRSTATGLGQLIVGNVDRYYPHGRAGIGVPLDEAVGMLRYIKDRYGTPANAWARYGKGQEGY